MNGNDQQSTSLWMTSHLRLGQVELERELRTEVCVVGAGIAGLTTAYLLAEAGNLTSTSALEKATADHRAARLHLVEERLASLRRLYQDCAEKRRDYSLKLPQWDEIARITGEAKGNSVQVRTDRLRATLRRRIQEEP